MDQYNQMEDDQKSNEMVMHNSFPNLHQNNQVKVTKDEFNPNSLKTGMQLLAENDALYIN